MTLEELKKIKESLTDLGDIVWNDMEEHSPTTVRNLDEDATILWDEGYAMYLDEVASVGTKWS